MALSLVSKIGTHLEDVRNEYFKEHVANEVSVDYKGRPVTRLEFKRLCNISIPMNLFLTGGTTLQTQANAAENGGCGLILVPEMKSGKGRYTNIDGSYGPLLDFYEESIHGISCRKADNIATVQKCRIHLLTAGVKNDWVDFVTKSGASSGTLGRVIPVITFNRTMIRILSERMPIYTFPLTGLKKIFTILEGKFRKVNSNCEEPPIILEFSSSSLMDNNYRKTNNLLVLNYN